MRLINLRKSAPNATPAESKPMTILSSDEIQCSDGAANYRNLCSAVLPEGTLWVAMVPAYWRSAREFVSTCMTDRLPSWPRPLTMTRTGDTRGHSDAHTNYHEKVGAPQTHGACRPRADADLDVPPNFRYWR